VEGEGDEGGKRGNFIFFLPSPSGVGRGGGEKEKRGEEKGGDPLFSYHQGEREGEGGATFFFFKILSSRRKEKRKGKKRFFFSEAL